MTDFDPVAYINEPRWRNSSLGLKRVRMLMEKLGNPQERLEFVHVAGTNGKGSVSAYLAAMAEAQGLRAGLFTSPYIEDFEERIRVNGANIPLSSLTEATLLVRDAADEVEAAIGEHPTEFELMFAVAMVYFAIRSCDLVILEVGLGGRLDATNVINPRLCVICRIGLDHTAILGDSLGEIAAEKAGIIKSGVPVVSWPQEREAMQAIEAKCEKTNSTLIVCDFNELAISPLSPIDAIRRFEYRGRRYETALLASYQPKNAALAIDAAAELGFTDEAVREGAEKAKWPGRFEAIADAPLTIVDGAHNPQGAEALAETLRELGLKDVTFVMGVLSDKDYEHVVSPLIPFARRFVTYAPDNQRALSAEGLAASIKAIRPEMPVAAVENAKQAIRIAREEEGPEGSVIAFGTLYSVGEIKRACRASF